MGLVFLRNTGEYLSRSGNEPILALTYAGVIPFTAMSYEVSASLANVDPASAKCLRGWTAAITAAALIDGIAICCFPGQTYALDPPGMCMAAASLLWALGVAGAYGLYRTANAKLE